MIFGRHEIGGLVVVAAVATGASELIRIELLDDVWLTLRRADVERLRDLLDEALA